MNETNAKIGFSSSRHGTTSKSAAAKDDASRQRGWRTLVAFMVTAMLTSVYVQAQTAQPRFTVGDQVDHPVDTRTADPELVEVISGYFRGRNARDLEGVMSYVSPELTTYIDVPLGWDNNSFDKLRDIYVQYMPTWPDTPTAVAYPIYITGNAQSALISFINTSEVFGAELRILSTIDIEDGKIVRWTDYWDGTGVDNSLYGLRVPADQYPQDFHEAEVTSRAAPKMAAASTALQRAFSAGDSEAAASLMTDDVIHEDLALRTQVLGRAAVTRYLSRVLDKSPYGQTSQLRHVVGGAQGGGFEWVGAPASGVPAGITALELDQGGRITKVTTVYNSMLMDLAARTELVNASADPVP